MMFASMAAAMDAVSPTGSWRPMDVWTYSGRDFTIGVHGIYFAFAQSAKIKSLDGLVSLLRQLGS